MKRSLRIAMALGALALFAGGWAWQSTQRGHAHMRAATDVPSPPGSIPADRRAGNDASSALPSPRAASVPRIDLPPQDAPLAPVFPELVRAARAGDVGAMCRLSFELNRCFVELPSKRRWIDIQTEILLEPDVDNEQLRMQMLARDTAKLEKLEEICVGVQAPLDLVPWRLLRDSARAGHVPSMIRFAMQFPIGEGRLLTHLDALEVYRDEAPGFLQRAADSGDPHAASAMLWALQGQGSVMPYFRLAPDDPVRMLAYTLVLRDLADDRTRVGLTRSEARLRRKLSAEDELEAKRQAQEMSPKFAQWRGKQVDLQKSLSKSADDCSRP